MDWGTVAQWLSACVAAIALVVALVTARMTRSDAKLSAIHAKLENIGGRIDLVEKRSAAVEQELKHVPSEKGFHELGLQMASMKGQIDVLVERVQPIRAMSERVQEALIELRK